MDQKNDIKDQMEYLELMLNPDLIFGSTFILVWSIQMTLGVIIIVLLLDNNSRKVKPNKLP